MDTETSVNNNCNWPLPWNNSKEMAFRKIYKDLIEKRSLTRVFRPGARPCGGYKGFCPEDEVFFSIIEETGSDLPPNPHPPLLAPEPAAHARITEVRVLKLDQLSEDYFVGTGPDVTSQETLRRHLGLIYNLPPEKLEATTDVTMITFTYL